MGTPVTARTDRAEPPRASPSILVIIRPVIDRKSTRLNSSHLVISYAVFCLKKKKNKRVHVYVNADGDDIKHRSEDPPRRLSQCTVQYIDFEVNPLASTSLPHSTRLLIDAPH